VHRRESISIWFVAQIPERLEVLSRAVSANDGRSVIMDYSPESLERLGDWFGNHIETRNKNHDELTRENDSLPQWFLQHGDKTNWMLTDQTLSLCVDIGIYFGEVMRKHHPVLNWDYVKSGRKFVDYNRPVIAPITGLIERMCPQQVFVLVAMKCVQGENAHEAFRKRWMYWNNLMIGAGGMTSSGSK